MYVYLLKNETPSGDFHLVHLHASLKINNN